ncbi:MAG: hypothetical protein OXI80_18905 [Caldilineaceae bacterium]|nr:hypothetical protein [Caldilineaceae bacterium]MDE0339750.1 hypothetical protein [Caldilineaceae bacterium]
MRVLRLAIPIILFAVFVVGCIVQADAFSDQNPFSAPDTMQSSDEATAPAPTPTIDKDDYIPTATFEYQEEKD